MKLIGGSKTLRPPPPPRPVILSLLNLFSQGLLSNRIPTKIDCDSRALWVPGDLFIRVGNGGAVLAQTV